MRFSDYFLAVSKFSIKLAVGTYIVFWFIRWISPRGSTSFFDLEIFSVVSFIVGAYLLVWLISFAGSRLSNPQVTLREKGISYISVEGNIYIPYKRLESFSITKTNLEETEYFVLSFKLWDGNEGFIEIDPKINKESVINLLKDKNIQMKTALRDPS